MKSTEVQTLSANRSNILSFIACEVGHILCETNKHSTHTHTHTDPTTVPLLRMRAEGNKVC